MEYVVIALALSSVFQTALLIWVALEVRAMRQNPVIISSDTGDPIFDVEQAKTVPWPASSGHTDDATIREWRKERDLAPLGSPKRDAFDARLRSMGSE